jgi:hypothetical protein
MTLLKRTAEKHGEIGVSCTITMCPHTALRVPENLGKHDICVVPNPSKPADLNPCDCFLFSELELGHEGGKNVQIRH